MNTTAPSRGRAAGRLTRVPLALTTLALVLALVASPRIGRGQDATPAEGDAQVIAQGLTAPPAERVAWRVLTEEIPVRAEARPSNRMPNAAGFVLARDVPVFISDQDTKQRTSLDPGEAGFVPTGANQTWASLTDAPGSVYAVELAERATARDPGNGELLLLGSSFTMPQGDYDLNLMGDAVDGGDWATVSAGDFPALVFATTGAVDVSSSRSEETVRLGRGEGVVLRGNISVRGRGDTRSTYVVGVIGTAVTGGKAATSVPAEEPRPTEEPAPTEEREPTATEEAPDEEERVTATPEPAPTEAPNEEPAATPAGASVRISVRVCRAGMTVATLNPRGCQRADGNYRLALVTPDGTRLRLNDAARVTPSFVRWSGLEPGIHALIVGDLPSGYVTYSLDGFPCCPFEGGYVIDVPASGTIDGTLYLLQDFPPVVVPTVPAPAATVAPAPTVAPVADGGDSDGDGISDADELNVYGTSPTLVDSDGDTIPDGVEASGSNGYRTAPALWDSDRDGVADNVEIQRGTNPNDPASR